MPISRCPRFAKRVLGVLGISLLLALAGITPAQAGADFVMAEKEYAFWCRKLDFLKAGGKWPTFGIEFLGHCAVFERYPGQFWYPRSG